MEKYKFLRVAAIMSLLVLVLAACGGETEESAETDESAGTEETDSEESTEESADESDSEESASSDTVEITDAHGTVEVPVDPETVVSLDSRSYETLDDWDVELAAAPVGLTPENTSYSSDESIEDIGNHREPDLEAIAAVEPDLVIVGQRFGGFYEDIQELVPEATVIDLNFDVSEEAETPGENLENGFKDNVEILGQIFDETEAAEQLAADFDASIENAREAYNGEDTIMSVIVSGGNINYSAPGNGRVWGPVYEILDLTSSMDVDASSDHEGDEISVEAIADTNPDWLFVMDRDAAVSSSEESAPAEDVIDDSPALQNTTAVSEGNIYYAPEDTYTNESIETYTEIFNNMADAIGE